MFLINVYLLSNIYILQNGPVSNVRCVTTRGVARRWDLFFPQVVRLDCSCIPIVVPVCPIKLKMMHVSRGYLQLVIKHKT